jgi:hypothetical protein
MAGMFGDKINSRSDFLSELTQAQRKLATLMARLPFEDPLQSIGKQLDAIAAWTANGRSPTKKERKSIAMGLQMFRDYESTDDADISSLSDDVGNIDTYVKFWPDDKTARDPKNVEYLFFTDL